MKESPAPGLADLFGGVHAQLTGTLPARPAVVTWYRYTSTKTTIRERDGRIFVRISDHLRDAPDAALRGVFGMLLCRIRGWPESRVPADERRAYQHAVDAEDVAARRSESRRKRGRKHIDPVGDHRSLLESFLRVTMETGLHVPDAPKLSWSQRDSRRRFGHHDADHDVIVLSRALDDPKVPEFVLDYVVYHELLHIVHPPVRGGGGKRIIHHRTFREAERRFPRWQEAERWLTKLARVRVPA